MLPERLFRSTLLGIALMGVTVLLSACSDDATAPANDDLTDAEFEAMVQALGEVGGFAFDLGEPARAPLAALDEGHRLAAETLFYSFEDSFPCPDGGAVDLAGSVNADFTPETGEGTYALQLDQTHRACMGTDQESGRQFQFDGNPKVSTQVSISINGEGALVALQGSQTGGIRWAVDAKQGTCAMDVTYQVTGAQSETPMVSVKGTLCGRTFEFQYQG